METTKVITGKVRFSYANVFEPRAVTEGGPLKYSVSIIIDKDDTKTIEKLEAAIEEAIKLGEKKLAGKSGAVKRSTLKLPLRDGDDDRDEEAYEGAMFLSANSSRKPGLVDASLQPIIDPDEFYSGCYGRASINFYAFDTNGNKGIACGLNNLQKLEDGERLDGGTSAEADFDDDLL